MQFCGLDVGTSGIKAIVFDKMGNIAAQAEREYDLELKSDGTRTLSATDIWDKTKDVLRSVAAQAGDIRAVAVCSFGESFVCVDKNGSEISEVMIYTDRRGEREYYEAMKKSSNLEIAQICGLPPSPTFSISKMLHIKNNLPEIYDKSEKMLLIQDYLNYKMTGCAMSDYSASCRTMLFDVHKREWSDILLHKFCIDREKLSDVKQTGTIIGEIHAEFAKETGLPDSAVVVTGGHDQPMAALGTGAGVNGTVCSLGTTECMTPMFRGALPPEVTLNSSLCSEPMWDPDMFSTLAYNATSGLVFKWFFEMFASDEKKPPYDLFEKKLPVEPTRMFVQPYMMGSGTPYMDHRARFALIGADLGTTRYEVYKAVMEGLVLDQRLNFEILVNHNINIGTLICVGGGAQNRPWMQIKADAMNVEVATLTCKHAGALGCAMACAYALGCYGSMEEAGQNMAHIKDVIQPNPTYKTAYDEKFELYKELRMSLHPYCEYATRQ